jgi:hypothetical protein
MDNRRHTIFPFLHFVLAKPMNPSMKALQLISAWANKKSLLSRLEHEI